MGMKGGNVFKTNMISNLKITKLSPTSASKIDGGLSISNNNNEVVQAFNSHENTDDEGSVGRQPGQN